MVASLESESETNRAGVAVYMQAGEVYHGNGRDLWTRMWI